jgi:serine O-acetyltransferase
MTPLRQTILEDLYAKAEWNYERSDRRALIKTLATDGTAAMILYRLMQWSVRRRWSIAASLFNKLNGIFNNCIIGREADFGPRFVLVHATGVVINGSVRGGADVRIEHQVTIGAERRQAPVIGDNVFIGAGAKILGPVIVGDDVRVGANAVVVRDVPAHCTVVGIPAQVVRRRSPFLCDTAEDAPALAVRH